MKQNNSFYIKFIYFISANKILSYNSALQNRHEKDEENKDSTKGYFNISDETMEILENIRQAISQEKHSTHVITGLLTALVIILTTFVLYLCFSRGISSMSKYVM